MNESKNTELPDQIEDKITSFAINGKNDKALDYISRIEKDYPDNLALQARKASRLYHKALADKGHDLLKDIDDYPQVKKAAELSENILENVSEDSSLASNARMYLAQIHGYLMNNKETAYKYAKKNWKVNENAFAANRLFHLAISLGDIQKAREWYETYRELAKKEGVEKYDLLIEKITILCAENKPKEARKTYEKALPLLPDNDVGKSIKKVMENLLGSLDQETKKD